MARFTNNALQLKKNKKSNVESKTQTPTEVVERSQRRQFKASYKAKILKETDNAHAGEITAVLRREGLYSSHLQKWRAERSAAGLEAKKRGPKRNPLTAEVKKLKPKLRD